MLDGHNRYEICRDAGLTYKTIEMDFLDRDHAMLWILKNQLGRRNLSSMQFEVMVGKEYELQKRIGRGGGDRRSEEANQRSQSGTIDRPERTRDRLAQEHGISPQKVARAADLHNSFKAIREVNSEIAKKLESGEIKASKKGIRTLGKALQQGTPEQKEQIESELQNDPGKAIDMAKEITAQSKRENHSPLPEVLHDDHVGNIITDAQASPTKSDSDLDILLKLANRISCPKCRINARTALKWSCCGLSIDEAANLAVDTENETNSIAVSSDSQDKEQSCVHEECAGNVTEDSAQKQSKSYSEMASWIPPDNSSPKTSKIIRAFSCLLKKDEAPRADSLANICDLPVEVVRSYLENAQWVIKDDSSQDGIVTYLPREPSA